jgi:outer membrane receptor protein involved in Fe transport
MRARMPADLLHPCVMPLKPRFRTVRTAQFLRAFVSASALAASAAFAAEASAPPGPSASGLADLSLEQLMEIPVETVLGASKYEQKITRAPASVTIVSSAEIAAFGQRTLADVLRSVRGFYLSDDSNYSYLGTRGFQRPGDYNTRVLVLVDGHRMNDNIYDSSYFGRETAIDVEAIDRVEVIRGPSSSIYGSSAILGVINVVTKRGAQLDGAELSAEAGSFGSHRSRLSYGRRLANGTEISLAATYFHAAGQPSIYYREFDPRVSPEPRAANGGVAENIDAETALGFSGNLTYRDLTISASLSSRCKTVPTASFGTVFNDARFKTTDTRGYVDVALNRELRPGLQLLARASYDTYAYHGDYPFDFAAPGARPDLVLNKDRADGDWLGTEWQLTTTLIPHHTLVTGFEYRANLEQEQISYYNTIPRAYTVDDHHDSQTLGLYLQDEWTLTPSVLVNAGLRFDQHFDSFGGTVNPRVSLIYNLHERTTLKFLYGQAFRAPNVYERFYFPNPTAELEPERIRTFEIAVEHYFARHHRIGLSAYRYNVSDLITQATTNDGYIYFANQDRARATGVELEFEGKYASGFRVRASYATQRTEDPNTGRELTSSPRHLAKAGFIQSFARDRLTAGFEAQYQSTVRTLAGRTTPGFWLGHLTLGAALTPRVQVSASIYNLFDVHYGYPGAEDHAQDVLPQPGRNFNVKATYKF